MAEILGGRKLSVRDMWMRRGWSMSGTLRLLRRSINKEGLANEQNRGREMSSYGYVRLWGMGR